MTEKEMKKTNGIMARIEERFAEIYKTKKQDGEKIFIIPDGSDTARIVPLQGKEEVFFVIEYGCGDDGDAFFPSDYKNIDDMIDDMLKETKE